LGDQPVMIAEFASAESGGNKSAWLSDAFAKIKSGYPRMKAVTWFNTNKETDWRVNSSDATLEGFRKAIADPYFLSGTPASSHLLRQAIPGGSGNADLRPYGFRGRAVSILGRTHARVGL
jgi:hypothetical protein